MKIRHCHYCGTPMPGYLRTCPYCNRRQRPMLTVALLVVLAASAILLIYARYFHEESGTKEAARPASTEMRPPVPPEPHSLKDDIERERAAREKTERERARIDKERAERLRAERDRLDRERVQRMISEQERTLKDAAEKERQSTPQPAPSPVTEPAKE